MKTRLAPQSWGPNGRTSAEIVNLGKETITWLIEYWKQELKHQASEEIQSRIYILECLRMQTEWKPLLPRLRTTNFFQLEETVIVLLPDDMTAWTTGKIQEIDNEVVTVDFQGEMISGHLNSSCIMKLVEFDYLRTHPDFARTWVAESATESDGHLPKELVAALTN